MQDFDSAATRHYHDAALLHQNGRLPNADHLAGFATECALKEILIGFLGAVSTKGKPTSQFGGARVSHGHLPTLWDEVNLVVAGRSAASSSFAAALSAPNPFQSWSVNDRYEDGQKITAGQVIDRIVTARTVIGHLQNAKLLGVLP